MTLPVDFRSVAWRELREAFHWYESRQAGLGRVLLAEVETALDDIRRLPDGHELVGKRTRRVLIRRFPYFLFYVSERHRIVITAMFHARRDPGGWSDRVRETPAFANA